MYHKYINWRAGIKWKLYSKDIFLNNDDTRIKTIIWQYRKQPSFRKSCGYIEASGTN